jgi:hypothetical protein
VACDVLCAAEATAETETAGATTEASEAGLPTADLTESDLTDADLAAEETVDAEETGAAAELTGEAAGAWLRGVRRLSASRSRSLNSRRVRGADSDALTCRHVPPESPQQRA